MTVVEHGGVQTEGMNPEQQREYVARCIAATKDLGIGKGANIALLAKHFVREMGIDQAVAANALRIQVSTLADQMFLARSVSPQTRDKFEETILGMEEKKEPSSAPQPKKNQNKNGGGSRGRTTFSPVRPIQQVRRPMPVKRPEGPAVTLAWQSASPPSEHDITPFAILTRVFEEKPPTSYAAEPEPELVVQLEAVVETRQEVLASLAVEPIEPVVLETPAVEAQVFIAQTGTVYKAPAPVSRLDARPAEQVPTLPDLPSWYKIAAYLKSIGARPNVIEAVCKQEYAAVQSALRTAKEYPNRLGATTYEEIAESLRKDSKVAKLLDMVIESNKPRGLRPPVNVPVALINEVRGRTVKTGGSSRTEQYIVVRPAERHVLTEENLWLKYGRPRRHKNGGVEKVSDLAIATQIMQAIREVPFASPSISTIAARTGITNRARRQKIYDDMVYSFGIPERKTAGHVYERVTEGAIRNRFSFDGMGQESTMPVELTEENVIRLFSRTVKRGFPGLVSDLAIALEITKALQRNSSIAPAALVIAEACGTTNRDRVSKLYDRMATKFIMPERNGSPARRVSVRPTQPKLSIDEKIALVRENPSARFVGRPSPRVEAARQEALRALKLQS